MTENEPGYEDECSEIVAVYDYEQALLDRGERLEDACEAPPIKEQTRPPHKRLLVTAAGFVLVAAIVATFLVFGQDDDVQESASVSSSLETSEPVWVDSLEPTLLPIPPRPSPLPSVNPRPTPEPVPRPSPAPRSESDFCSAPNSHKSYQATALPQPWPFIPEPGWEWVVGPAGLPPKVIPVEKVCWWWVWFMDYSIGGDNWSLCQTPPN